MRNWLAQRIANFAIMHVATPTYRFQLLELISRGSRAYAAARTPPFSEPLDD